MSLHHEKVQSELTKMVARFIEINSNNQSLITVTHCELSDDLKKANVFISVFPEDKEGPALDFLKRNRSDIREYIKKNGRFGRIPFVEVMIDKGEKNRQLIDKLLIDDKSKE